MALFFLPTSSSVFTAGALTAGCITLTHPLGLLILHTTRPPETPWTSFRAQLSALQEAEFGRFDPVNSHPASLSDPDIYLLLKVSSSSCLFRVLTPSVPHGFVTLANFSFVERIKTVQWMLPCPFLHAYALVSSAGPLVFKQDLLLPKTDPTNPAASSVGLCSWSSTC